MTKIPNKSLPRLLPASLPISSFFSLVRILFCENIIFAAAALSREKENEKQGEEEEEELGVGSWG